MEKCSVPGASRSNERQYGDRMMKEDEGREQNRRRRIRMRRTRRSRRRIRRMRMMRML